MATVSQHLFLDYEYLAGVLVCTVGTHWHLTIWALLLATGLSHARTRQDDLSPPPYSTIFNKSQKRHVLFIGE